MLSYQILCYIAGLEKNPRTSLRSVSGNMEFEDNHKESMSLEDIMRLVDDDNSTDASGVTQVYIDSVDQGFTSGDSEEGKTGSFVEGALNPELSLLTSENGSSNNNNGHG